MKKIIDILKQNKLYTCNSDIKASECNRINDFIDNYTFNGSKKHKIPNNISRNSDGALNIDEIPYIISKKNKTILLCNGSKLLIEDKNKDDIDKELLIMYFLKSLNINTANYDYALIDDKKFLVSSYFTQNNESIIKEYKGIFDEDIKLANKDNMKTHYLKTLFSDIIYGNLSRFPDNFGIITGGQINNMEKPNRICPLFNNSINVLNRTDCEDIVNKLLTYEEITHWIHGPFKKASLYDANKRLIKEKNININDKLYNDFGIFFKDSEQIINDSLNGALKINIK